MDGQPAESKNCYNHHHHTRYSLLPVETFCRLISTWDATEEQMPYHEGIQDDHDRQRDKVTECKEIFHRRSLLDLDYVVYSRLNKMERFSLLKCVLNNIAKSRRRGMLRDRVTIHNSPIAQNT